LHRAEREVYYDRGFAMEFSHHYRTLGILAGASQKEIAQAYRRLARRFHPDLQPAEQKAWAEEQMKQLNEAYAVLSDPQARARYDIALWRHLAALSRIRRGGSSRQKELVVKIKSVISAVAIGFLLLGVVFYLLDWNVLFQGLLTAGQMLGLRWAFAQAWMAVLATMLFGMRSSS
jgi:hypothetical protein